MNISTKLLSRFAAIIVIASLPTVADAQLPEQPSVTITIDEDVLDAFVDEPCHHFERARDTFLAGDVRTAANELRTAEAFLTLEAARAAPQGKVLLNNSVEELRRLASAIQRDQIDSVDVLKRAFARAHYALAGHHCIKTAHRCCRPMTLKSKQETARAARDMSAATLNLKRGFNWGGETMDQETQEMLDAAKLSASKLTENTPDSQNQITRSIHSVHRKLESLTGRKIMLAPNPDVHDDLGPSIFK